jgi:2-dehydropantoate 2-reductase
MRIAVMAAGAVGGYYGGRIAAAGHDVTFIARGAHRAAIRRDGLKIESPLGDLHLKHVAVSDDPKQEMMPRLAERPMLSRRSRGLA